MPRAKILVSISICLLIVATANGTDQGPSSRQEIARTYIEAHDFKNRLRSDYRTLVDTYYKFKRASPDPDNFPNLMYDPKQAEELSGLMKPESLKRFTDTHVQKVAEFDSQLLLEFERELLAQPELQDNVFMKEMYNYGRGSPRGAANDILQRMPSYFMNMKKTAGAELPDAIKLVIHDVGAFALFEGAAEFAAASKQNGYPMNQNIYDPMKKAPFLARLKEFEKEYTRELKALGFKRTKSNVSWTKINPAINCPEAYAKIQ
jgi:hypothetical protein